MLRIVGVFVCCLVILGQEEGRHYSSHSKGRNMHDNLGMFHCPLGYMIVPQHPNQVIRTPSPKERKKKHKDSSGDKKMQRNVDKS